MHRFLDWLQSMRGRAMHLKNAEQHVSQARSIWQHLAAGVRVSNLCLFYNQLTDTRHYVLLLFSHCRSRESDLYKINMQM